MPVPSPENERPDTKQVPDMPARVRKLFVSILFGNVLLCLIFVILKEVRNESSAVQHNIKCKMTENFKDYNCICTLENIISKDEEGYFIIPQNDVLVNLPVYVHECLYHRYTTTLQSYCSKRSRHGSIDNGWNICVDGCYNPTADDVVHVLSTQNEFINDKSVQHTHHSRVQRYDIRNSMNPGKKLSFATIGDFNNSPRKKDILIIDVGDSTKNIVNHILKSGTLDTFQQLSIRTSYGDLNRTKIDYILALNHLRQLYDYGFRIYWSRIEWKCILKNNKNRTSCVYLDMVYKKCRDPMGSMEHQHLIIPEYSQLMSMNKLAQADLYHKYLTSTQIHCKEIVRLGGNRGGWDICNDLKYRPPQSCLVYSFGICWNFQFDDAIAAEFDCEVHSFDPSMNVTADFKRSANLWFHNLGLTDKTFYDVKRKWKMSSLQDIRKQLGHTSRTLHIVKIDIEWSEWEAIPEMIQSKALQDVTQLYIEFHSYGSLKHLMVLKLLYDEGYRIFWYHRNSKCKIKRPLVEYTVCNEVYFLREKK